MNKQRCQHPYCQAKALRVLKSNKNIYAYFCNEHFEKNCKLIGWTYDATEDSLMQPILAGTDEVKQSSSR